MVPATNLRPGTAFVIGQTVILIARNQMFFHTPEGMPVTRYEPEDIVAQELFRKYDVKLTRRSA